MMNDDSPGARSEPASAPDTIPAQLSSTSGVVGARIDHPDVPDPAHSSGEPIDEHSDAVAGWRATSQRRNQKAKRPFWVELPILIVIAFALTFLIQTFIAKVYYVPSGSMEQTLHGVSSGGDRILASKIVYDFRDPKQGDVVVFKGPDTWTPELPPEVNGSTSWFGKVLQSLGSVVGIAPPNEKDFVKRVVAVGGQTVACCDTKGNVTVDGKSLDEPYIYQPLPFSPGTIDCTETGDGKGYASQRCFAPFKVPAGQLWVMGDHRSQSSDSSYNCQGRTAAGAKAYEVQQRLEENATTSCFRPIPVANVIGKAVFIVMPPSRWNTIGDPDIDPGASALGGSPVAAVPALAGVLATLGLRGSWALRPAARRRRARFRRGRSRRNGRPDERTGGLGRPRTDAR